MKKVSIISVNYNQPAVTEEFIASFNVLNNYSNFELIIVDNGSSVDWTPIWKEKYNNVLFIRSNANLGFAGGNNLGITQATGDYLFFVNNDTEWGINLTEGLVNILDQNPDVGVVSPKILYFEDPHIIQYAGFTPMNFNTARNRCIGQFEEDDGQYDNSTGPTGYAHGAAMMVRRKAIDQAGVMPENYFLYYEEMDWCESIKRSGYQIWVEPKATIYHKESISVGKHSTLKEYFMTRNRILFIRRNAPLVSGILFALYFCCIVMPRNLLRYLIGKRPDLASAFLKAAWWNLRHKKDSVDHQFA